MAEPIQYAFTSTGVFDSYDGVNYAINTTASVTISSFGQCTTINSTSFSGFNSNSTSFVSTKPVVPSSTGALDLGSASLRWATIYTSDLSLNNGIGDWTIVEGEDDLFLYNNKKNKVYKFNLTEVDPADATPKKS